MKTSWKTTLCGFISALGVALKQSEIPNLQLIGNIIEPIGLLCVGYYAKDNNADDVKKW